MASNYASKDADEFEREIKGASKWVLVFSVWALLTTELSDSDNLDSELYERMRGCQVTAACQIEVFVDSKSNRRPPPPLFTADLKKIPGKAWSKKENNALCLFQCLL